MDDGSVEIAARKLLNQLSELFKTHPRENQWTKECQPMAKVVPRHYGHTCTWAWARGILSMHIMLFQGSGGLRDTL